MADDENAETLSELARSLGVSRERVRQLESRLKERLAKHFRVLSHTPDGEWLREAVLPSTGRDVEPSVTPVVVLPGSEQCL